MFDTGTVAKSWAEENNIPHHYQSEITSTNDWAKEEGSSKNCLFITSFQRFGRGRGENAWQELSPGSHFSLSWSFSLTASPHPTLSAKTGLALIKSLRGSWNYIDFALKAPNDIYVREKKIAGILIETISQGDQHLCVIGIGLNVWENPLTASTCLKNVLPSKALGEKIFFNFLSRLNLELNLIIKTPSSNLLYNDRQELKEVLNQFHAFAKDQVSEVSPDGSITQQSGTTHWASL